MGKIAAERMRAYRQRMSEEKKAAAKEANRQQQEMCRAKWTGVRKKKENVNSKVRLKALSVDQVTSDSSATAFASAQSLGKALSRVRKVLPCSPRKKKAVVVDLASKFGIVPTVGVPQESPHVSALPRETVDLVKSFYTSDLVSRQLAGKKTI
jgi:hypothetical protein